MLVNIHNERPWKIVESRIISNQSIIKQRREFFFYNLSRFVKFALKSYQIAYLK